MALDPRAGASYHTPTMSAHTPAFDRDAFLRRIMSEPEGALFMRWLLLDVCATFITPLGETDLETGMLMGRQAVGLDLFNALLTVNPAVLTQIFQEETE